MSASKAKKKEIEREQIESGQPSSAIDKSYRPCSMFIWLDKAPRAPAWWIDQTVKENESTKEGKRKPIKCPGVRCHLRTHQKDGNRQCSNGGLCKECCDYYQRNGFLPSCGYLPHNQMKKLEEVSDAKQAKTAHCSDIPYCRSQTRRPHPRSHFSVYPELLRNRSSAQVRLRRAQSLPITREEDPNSHSPQMCSEIRVRSPSTSDLFGTMEYVTNLRKTS